MDIPRPNAAKRSKAIKMNNASQLTEAEVIAELRAIPLEERVRAVTNDVQSKNDRYRIIEAHQLAELLGIQDAWKPSTDWSFLVYAHPVQLDEHLEGIHEQEEILELLEGLKECVSEKRWAELQSMFKSIESGERKFKSDLLAPREREIVQRKIQEQDLDGNRDNGIYCLAHFGVKTPDGDGFVFFEAIIEDDGDCINLKTPYDERDGGFVDLTDCLTEEG